LVSKIDSSEEAKNIEFDERQAADEADPELWRDQPGGKFFRKLSMVVGGRIFFSS